MAHLLGTCFISNWLIGFSAKFTQDFFKTISGEYNFINCNDLQEKGDQPRINTNETPGSHFFHRRPKLQLWEEEFVCEYLRPLYGIKASLMYVENLEMDNSLKWILFIKVSGQITSDTL